MLYKIPLLTCLSFAAIYPLCFWISRRDPLKNNFHHFHIGVANLVGGVATVVLFFSAVPQNIKVAAIAWQIVFLGVSSFSWRRETVPLSFVTVVSALGILVFLQAQGFYIGRGPDHVMSGLLGGLILCCSLFAMNLGHWYLNVHGLPITHLMRAVYVFAVLLILRALWDGLYVFLGKVFYDGEWISIIKFLQTMDGFLLLIALFFGTVFPLISLYFVKGTLDVKSTQSATGILYVVLSAVLIGDITYKYYQLKFGLAL